MVQNLGLGRHAAAIVSLGNPNTLVIFAKMQLVYMSAYALSLLLPRLIILSIYLRFFVHRRFRIVCWILVVISILYFCVAIMINMFSCRPLQALWEPQLQNAQCIDLNTWWISSSAPNIAMDLVVEILPIPVIWNLKLPMKDRIGLVLIFASGFW